MFFACDAFHLLARLIGKSLVLFVSQTNPRSPDFKHKLTKDSLWTRGCHNPPWVEEELIRRGVRSQELINDGEDKAHKGRALSSNNSHQKEVAAIVALLKACAKRKDLHQGSRLHGDILKRGLLENDIYVGNNLINMYAKCGALGKAQEVCDKLSFQDVVSWSTLIAGYAQHGRGKEALTCFERMQCQGINPDAVTFVSILKACGSVGAANKGEEIHSEIVKAGLLGKYIVLSNALVAMYAKCGMLTKSQKVFDELPARNIITWNILITGYVQHGHGEEALNCFERMRCEEVSPDAVTFTCILKACGSIGAAEKGKEIHGLMVREGFLQKNILVGTALVDMYAKCGDLAKAAEVFYELPVQDVVLWSTLIVGYVQHGHGEEAIKCFKQMQQKGLTPDAVAFVCILKACGSTGAADKGKEVHAEIVRVGLLENNIVVGNALVDMYAKCGMLDTAQKVLDELSIRNVVSYTALITGYAQHGGGDEALNCFEQMQCEGLSPNTVTFLSILKACGSIGAAGKGKEIHAEIVRQGLLEKNIALGSALVDMYAKCGLLERAEGVFNELPMRSIVSWSALIAGYAQLGKYECVLDLFNKMIEEGTEPDPVSLTCVLNACSHSGLVDEGQIYFKTMSTRHGVIPTLQHYTCMVDLYGRASRFDKALAVIDKMPSSNYLPVWNSLLGACRKWGNTKLGRMAFDCAVKLDEKEAAPYICMMNIYAAAGMLEEADKIVAMRRKNSALKKPG